MIFSEQLKFLFLKFKPIFGGILEIICSKMIEILACYLLNCVIFVFPTKMWNSDWKLGVMCEMQIENDLITVALALVAVMQIKKANFIVG